VAGWKADRVVGVVAETESLAPDVQVDHEHEVPDGLNRGPLTVDATIAKVLGQCACATQRRAKLRLDDVQSFAHLVQIGRGEQFELRMAPDQLRLDQRGDLDTVDLESTGPEISAWTKKPSIFTRTRTRNLRIKTPLPPIPPASDIVRGLRFCPSVNPPKSARIRLPRGVCHLDKHLADPRDEPAGPAASGHANASPGGTSVPPGHSVQRDARVPRGRPVASDRLGAPAAPGPVSSRAGCDTHPLGHPLAASRLGPRAGRRAQRV
jgi:hypothetical protein